MSIFSEYYIGRSVVITNDSPPSSLMPVKRKMDESIHNYASYEQGVKDAASIMLQHVAKQADMGSMSAMKALKWVESQGVKISNYIDID